jgi:hypothetical protein
MDAYLIEEHSSSLISETPLAVAAAAAWLGLGFVMVVVVACWARGAPAWGGVVRSLFYTRHRRYMHALQDDQ